MNIKEQAALLGAAIIIIKKMDLIQSGTYGVSEGGLVNTNTPTEIEIITLENIAQITAGKIYTLSNSTYFSPTIAGDNKREFTNLTIVNLSACPIDIRLEGDPRKYYTLTASSEFTMSGSRVLKFKNLAIKNRSALGSIEANQLVVTMW